MFYTTLSFVLLITPVQAEESVDSYLDLTLEDLLNMEVTSVSKKKQRLNEAAAAVYVITQEDIRRSGVTSIPEALRMAPGIHVGRLDANKWAISSRGFNNQFANKLLVLINLR
ncbi:MAG: TonB-dependent receptor plug domain-containing protein [Candidatus Thiodiazotropha sp. (ex Troendleina suluensis)]|nr:TonB-dependent receptor plug domain-containing protein [Candidatus Thiodiazotropha sp. (ex Troendleina suluensis)]